MGVSPKGEHHRLLGDDDLAILVVTAVGADVMRKLHGAATGARGLSSGRNLHVGGPTTVRTDATLLLFRYWHDDLSYYLKNVAITRK